VPNGLAIVCGLCRRTEPRFDRARAVLDYAGAAAEAIKAAKYRRRRSAARALGEVLVQQVWRRPHLLPGERVDFVLPVPLHPNRLSQRGFNQAEEIVSPLCESLGLALRPGLLKRVKDIPPQVGLSAKARRENVKGAFALASGEPLCGKRILVFDDVMTTGATVNECARVLKRGGAAEVHVLALARER